MIWAQWTWLVLITLSFLARICLLGKPRRKASPTVDGTDIAASLLFAGWVLLAGGFSHIFGWPN